MNNKPSNNKPSEEKPAPLFRAEAIRHRTRALFGDVVLAAPLSTWVITGLLVIILMGVAAFGVFGKVESDTIYIGQSGDYRKIDNWENLIPSNQFISETSSNKDFPISYPLLLSSGVFVFEGNRLLIENISVGDKIDVFAQGFDYNNYDLYVGKVIAAFDASKTREWPIADFKKKHPYELWVYVNYADKAKDVPHTFESGTKFFIKRKTKEQPIWRWILGEKFRVSE